MTARQPEDQLAPGAPVALYRFGRCELRPADRTLLVDGEATQIGGRAFDALRVLLEERGRTVTKAELLDRVWPRQHVEEHNLSIQVSNLRRVIGRDVIATIPRRGYRLAATVTCVWEAASAGAQPPIALPALALEPDAALHFGRLEWRPDSGVALLDGQRADLGSRALQLLDVLICERHRVVSKAELIVRVWPGLVVEENNLPVQVATLRKLLGQDMVRTIPGRGYRFAMQADEAVQTPDLARMPAPGQTNLPLQLETLFGRADDLDQLARRLQEHRLITIVGVGGIGKTRAALALGAQQASRFAQGVWWVDLGAVVAAADVGLAVAAAARVQLAPGDIASALALALTSRHTLIVLDNCEHLVDEVARIAAAVLEAADRVCLIATSQEPLRIAGEHVYRLGGLPLPQAGASFEQARGSAALMLLERRARDASGRFELTDAMLPAAIALCRQLDGIPLAIEMAAARLPQLGATALQAALGERLRWLRNGRRTAPPRQQTLRDTLDWSWSLLDGDEQAVLSRLAVFAGSFGLNAAQQVAGGGALDAWAVAEAMSGLADRSLIQVHGDEPPRYRLLETMRLYADDQLQARGERAAVRAAHTRVMAAIGDETEHAYWTTPDAAWLARHEPEYDDLHAAFVHACAGRDAAAGACTLDALYRLDELRMLPAALGARLAAAQSLLPYAGDASALRIRLVLGSLFLAQVPLERMSKLDAVKPTVEMARSRGDVPRLYRSLLSVAFHATVAGDHAAAAPALTQALALELELEHLAWPARLKWFGAVHRTFCHSLRGDAAATMASLRLELAHAEQAGSDAHALAARCAAPDVALMCGDVEQAVRLGIDLVAELRRLGRDAHLANASSNLCAAHLASGDLSKAAEAAAAGIELVWRHDRAGYLLDHLSLLAAKQQRFEDSMLLIGCADAWYAQAQYAREANEAASVRSAVESSEQALGRPYAGQLRQRGTQHDLAMGKQLALSCIDASKPPHPATARDVMASPD